MGTSKTLPLFQPLKGYLIVLVLLTFLIQGIEAPFSKKYTRPYISNSFGIKANSTVFSLPYSKLYSNIFAKRISGIAGNQVVYFNDNRGEGVLI